MEEEVKEEKLEQKNEKKQKKKVDNEKKKNNWLKYVLIIIALIIIILLLLISCGKKKYKIKLHYGDEVIEVDENFKLEDLEVEGGKISFLVDSHGYILDPNDKLDHEKEYSAHIIPEGKEKVKVTYKWDDKSLVIEYQKGAGLLFPESPVKKGYVFIAWKFEDTDDYPIYMMPVDHDMVIVAEFEKINEDGKCTINCDTNKDGKCNLNCDTNKDGKPDTNVDTNGDGKPDLNIDKDHDNICDLNCDTNKDGKPDTNIDKSKNGIPDTNIDTDNDGIPDVNIDTNGDGKCDKNCVEGNMITINNDMPLTFYCYEKEIAHAWFRPKDYIFVSLIFDGKNIPESDFVDNGNGEKIYDYSSYIGSGKTVDVHMEVIRIDGTGQKYYKIHDQVFTFVDGCDKEAKEITYKCEDYDNEGGFLLTSPVKKDQINYIKIDNNEVKIDSYQKENSEGYPLYDLSDYFEDGKKLNIEIGFNSKDSEGNTKYNVIVLFPVCEFGVSEYTLTFDPNGGAVNPTSRILYRGQVIYDLPFPTRSGYQFVGWYTAKEGGEYVSEETNTPMPDNNMTLYAHWESNETPRQTYTLTYNANGGNVSPKSKTLNEGSNYGNLPTPSRSGYSFNGWYTSANGGSKVSSSTIINGNTTIYAHWTKIEEQPTPPPVDNGTISLSASSTCVVSGQRSVITAAVNNAIDGTVNWNVDRCLSQSGSGNSITVIPNGCGSTATVTGSLNNGKSSSVELTIENTLTVTVTDYGTNSPNNEGKYYGVKTITTNVPAVISSTNRSILSGESSSLRTSVETYAGMDGIVTITTPCGQTKTIRWTAAIN